MRRDMCWQYNLFFDEVAAGVYICHIALRIPEGKMVGSLVNCKGFTENTYISELFGYNCLILLDCENLNIMRYCCLIADCYHYANKKLIEVISDD